MTRTLASTVLLIALLAPATAVAEDEAAATLSRMSLAQESPVTESPAQESAAKEPPAQESLAQAPACLSRAEQRLAIANGQAVTLGTAIRAARGSVRARGAREVVNARLCRGPEGLRYVLTVLARDGKVTHTSVDANSGKVVDAR